MIILMSFRFVCVIKTTELLYRLKNTTDLILSILQCNTVLKCIDFVIALVFIPCLIPSVWNSFGKKQTISIQFMDDISPSTVMANFYFIVILLHFYNNAMNTYLLYFSSA